MPQLPRETTDLRALTQGHNALVSGSPMPPSRGATMRRTPALAAFHRIAIHHVHVYANNPAVEAFPKHGPQLAGLRKNLR